MNNKDLPALPWSDAIDVVEAADGLIVCAEEALLEDQGQEHDALRDYQLAPQAQAGQARTGKNAPHIRFANANTDKGLRAFVAKYGPVAATHVFHAQSGYFAAYKID